MSTDLERSRIRDNQRRSRAKKKEYVQELEERLRLNQRQGVEASAEVQQAARLVAEENRKLRELLKLVGIGDEYIQRYIHTGHLGPTSDASFRPLHEQGSAGAAVRDLEARLGPRRPSGLDPNVPFAPPLGRRKSSDLSLSSVSTSNSPWDGLNSTTDHPSQSTWAMEPASLGENISSEPFVPSISMATGRLATHGQPSFGWGPPPISSSSSTISTPHSTYGLNQYGGLQSPLEGIPPQAQPSQLDDRPKHTPSSGYGPPQSTLAYIPPSSISPGTRPTESMPPANVPFGSSGLNTQQPPQTWHE